MSYSILVTGGPVHAHLDDVKIITNRFRGQLMMRLARDLSDRSCDVTFLTAKGNIMPLTPPYSVIDHDGFDDYRQKVLELAPKFSAVVLGAAVCNLIPVKRIVGKFPSHNYRPGDIIPIDFTIASRVIDEVKKVAPNTHLFGFKLLSGVPHDELITAAYDVLLVSHATAVFANDAVDLMTVEMVTKERGTHPIPRCDIAGKIVEFLDDEYYHTVTKSAEHGRFPEKMQQLFSEVMNRFAHLFTSTPEGLIFGTVAMRLSDGSFVTTCRGKRELDHYTIVTSVDHEEREVTTNGEKATLNAPLLAHIFETLPNVKVILHTHQQVEDLPTLPYAPPGTVRDSQREITSSFNIAGHGSFLLFNEQNEIVSITPPTRGGVCHTEW